MFIIEQQVRQYSTIISSLIQAAQQANENKRKRQEDINTEAVKIIQEKENELSNNLYIIVQFNIHIIFRFFCYPTSNQKT